MEKPQRAAGVGGWGGEGSAAGIVLEKGGKIGTGRRGEGDWGGYGNTSGFVGGKAARKGRCAIPRVG